MSEHPQVTPSGHLNCPIGNRWVVNVATGHVARTRGFANCVGQGLKIIRSGLQRVGIRSDANDLPASRGRQALTVHLAQVVAMWLGIGGQWSKHRCGICIDVRQCRGRRGLTGGLGTATTSHTGTLAAHARKTGQDAP